MVEVENKRKSNIHFYEGYLCILQLFPLHRLLTSHKKIQLFPASNVTSVQPQPTSKCKLITIIIMFCFYKSSNLTLPKQ